MLSLVIEPHLIGRPPSLNGFSPRTDDWCKFIPTFPESTERAKPNFKILTILGLEYHVHGNSHAIQKIYCTHPICIGDK